MRQPLSRVTNRSLSQRSRRHFTYLNHFPIVNDNPTELAYQQNQRRIALYGVGTKARTALILHTYILHMLHTTHIHTAHTAHTT